MLPGSQTHERKAGLAYWSARVLEECDKASLGFEADPVHDLRVAIRRCRSMADGFLSVDPDPAWKQMKRLAKPLFASLGELRDTQVMMEWVAKLSEPNDPVAESLTAELTRREAAQKTAAQQSLAAFDRQQWTALNQHLANRTGLIPLEGPVFQHLALERWTDARELHRQALKNRSSLAYHHLRIGIKRLRYTVENFLPERHKKWSKDLRDLQDDLGEVHDLDVLRMMLRAHAELQPADRVRWQERVVQEREQRLNFYRQKMLGKQSLWTAWRAELPEGTALEEAGLEKLRTWMSLLDPDNARWRQVTKLALQLYDGLTQCGILKFLGRSRSLLEAAAILHRIGRDAEHQSGAHQKRGYRLVSKLEPPQGWSEEDMRCVAALVRHHRGKLPAAANDSSFVGLDGNLRSETMALLGILRLANAFDDACEHRVTDVKVELQNGGVVVEALGLQELSDTAQRVARARYLLESVCMKPIMIAAVAELGATPRPRVQRRRRSAVAAR